METPASAYKDGPSTLGEAGGNCELSVSTSLDAKSQLICMIAESVVIPETGVAANLVRFRRLGSRNSLIAKRAFPWVETYPAKA